PAPAAVDDAVTAFEWVAGARSASGGLGFRPQVIALAGDSAGGALAELAALRTRKAPIAPDFVALAFPNTDLEAVDGSMISNAHGYGLEPADIEWLTRQWVPDRARWSDPDVSPLKAKDLTGFPTAIIVTCELDPLRDQGEAFGERLRSAGVEVLLRREPGMVHNFLLWDLISPSCAAASDRFADDIRRATTAALARQNGAEPVQDRRVEDTGASSGQ
ncbi:MAG: alpha/beta hydrolase fold domain-containing protein, partial [Acidimicrobiia bacterium]